jgi:hypothetical protein
MRYPFFVVSLFMFSLNACSPTSPLLSPASQSSSQTPGGPSASPVPTPVVSVSPVLPPLASVPQAAMTPVKVLVVQPAVLELSVGQEKSLDSVVLVQEDNTVTVLNKRDLLSLSVSNPTLAEVTSSGMVRALKEGETTITAQLGALRQTLILKVGAVQPSPTPAPMSISTPPPVIVVSPSPQATPSPTAGTGSPYKSLGTDQSTYRLKVGETYQVILSVELQSGDIGLLNDRTKAEWQSALSSVATISPSGLIAARTAGTTTMTVNYGGLSRTFSVVVTAS